MLSRTRSHSSHGFTLIELLVVIAIIGILSSVVLASLNSAREKARDTRRAADIKQVQLALELYYDGNGNYPIQTGNGTLLSGIESELVPAFMPQLPEDPTNGNTSTGYRYYANANRAGYGMLVRLEGSPWNGTTWCYTGYDNDQGQINWQNTYDRCPF